MRSCRNLLPFLVAAFCCALAAAQPPVDDGDLQELPGVTVRPDAEDLPEPLRDAPADEDFDFEFDGSGFEAPAPYPDLTQQRFEGLDGITRGEKSLFDLPQLGTVIDRQDLIERQPQDMFQALEKEVGVLVQRTARGQASPFVRGLTGQQVLILIDGVRLNNSTFRAGANQYFNTIDPGQVQRIEVLRGSQSVLYGSDAIGGAINVLTRGPDAYRGDYSGGSFTEYFSTADYGSYSRMNVEGWGNLTGVFAGASYLNVNDLDTGGELGRQPFTSYDQYAGDVKVNHLLDDETMLTLALSHFEQENVPRSDRFPPFVFGPPAGTPRPTFFDPQQRDLAYLRLQGLGDGWVDGYMVTGSYARQKEGSREVRSATREDLGEFDVATGGVTVLASSDFDALGRLTYGADYYHDDVDAFKNRLNPLTGAVTPDVPQFPDDSIYDRAGAFATWDVRLTDRLSTMAGVRYENVDLRSTPIVVIDPPGPPPPVNVPTPISPSCNDWVGQVGMVYELTPWLHLCSSISEGFRAPNLDDLVATNTLVQQAGQDVPSIDLGPEHSTSYDLGLKFNGPRIRSQVFVYWIDLEDNILRTPGPAVGLFQRANRDSYLNGVEWAGECLLDAGWSVYGNFAYQYGQNLEDDIPLSRIPPTQGIVGLRWRDEERRNWIDVYAWLVRKQDRLNFQDFTDARIPVGGTPGYQTYNVRVGRTLGVCRNHQVSLTLENLFDEAYRVHGSGVDGAGFNAVCGYTYLY